MARRIILLSDGTGNSAAKLAKTNVWRTYQALEQSGDQVAMYDDGVGTSAFKPLAILGGAFGWGLKRNVLSLYKFLCRNYGPGDEIHAFGFSRGAFTIRVLAGLVLHQGLVRWHSEEELDLLSKAAYRDYRVARFHRTFSLAAVGRALRNGFIGVRNTLLGIRPYDRRRNTSVPTIKFLGLWDTVDAYGLPIKELKVGIDRFLWPLYFDDPRLNPRVEKACHALALDDERATFHPLVWDETGEDPANRRIHQVWFAGVHSNVGGGYPDDALSHVSLLWILDHAAASGLRFKRALLHEYHMAASPFGRMYDSRQGISSYYRYAPRRVDSYPQDNVIHESVYLRIADGGDQYAPISLPAPLKAGDEYEIAWDTVWWRRVAYWLLVLLTVALVQLAWFPWPLEGPDEFAVIAARWLIAAAKAATPAMLASWLDGFAKSPTVTLALVCLVIAAVVWGGVLKGRIRDRASEIWRVRTIENRTIWLKQSKLRWRAGTWTLVLLTSVAAAAALAFGTRPFWQIVAVVLAACAFALLPARRMFEKRREGVRDAKAEGKEKRGWGLLFAHAVRTWSPAIWAWRFVANAAFPFFFAMAVLVLALALLNRLAFEVLDLGGTVCRKGTAAPLGLGEEKVVPLRTREGCLATGVQVEKGAKYVIQLRDVSGWNDASIPVGGPEGFESTAPEAPWYMPLAVPLRRSPGENWFKPIAHVGHHSSYEKALSGRTELADLPRHGQLFVFVNDAVFGIPGVWDSFYANNEGTALVAIRKTAEAPSGAGSGN